MQDISIERNDYQFVGLTLRNMGAMKIGVECVVLALRRRREQRPRRNVKKLSTPAQHFGILSSIYILNTYI